MTVLPNGESKEPVIRLFVPPAQWYEDSDGNRFVPSAEESTAPNTFDVMHFVQPNVITHTVYREYDGDTSEIGSVDMSWNEALVLRMATSTPYDNPWTSAMPIAIAPEIRGKPLSLSAAIMICASACERCINALSWYYGLTERIDGAEFMAGYLAGDVEWRESNARCHFCATDKELDAIADATLPGERFFVDTPRRAPELFNNASGPIAETRSPDVNFRSSHGTDHETF